MKKIVLGLMIFLATSLFATDVSNFDIKGIKLGMSEKELLNILKNKIKCEKVNTTNFYTSIDSNKNGQIISKRYNCTINKHDSIARDLTYDKKVYHIQRLIKPNIEPNWIKLKKNIINKYGNTRYIKQFNSSHIKMCWGKCKSNSGYDAYWIPIDNIGLVSTLDHYNN